MLTNFKLPEIIQSFQQAINFMYTYLMWRCFYINTYASHSQLIWSASIFGVLRPISLLGVSSGSQHETKFPILHYIHVASENLLTSR